MIKNLLTNKDTKVLMHWLGWFEGVQGGKHIGSVYRSDDRRNIQTQVSAIKQLADGIVVDWYGGGKDMSPPTNLATINLMMECEQQGLQFSIMLDGGIIRGLTADPTLRTNVLLAEIQYCRDNFFSSPAYWQWNGKPVLWEFSLREAQVDMTRMPTDVAMMYRDHPGPGAAGRYAWVNGLPPDSPEAYMGRFMAGNDPSMLNIPCVFAGFDDHDPKNPTQSIWPGAGAARYIDPKYGDTWLNLFQIINAAGAFPYLQICTWNDYEEGTAVEPWFRRLLQFRLH